MQRQSAGAGRLVCTPQGKHHHISRESPLTTSIAELEAQLAALKATQTTTTAPPALAAAKQIKLDLGCGKNKKEGFIGVDCLPFPGVDVQLNIGTDRWPWDDSTVDEVHCSHTVEHLQFNPEKPERIHFVNELWRVLKPDAKATIVVPHWCSNRFYGDYTHREPVSEMWPFYLKKTWRETDAPHCVLYACDFDCTVPAYSPHPELQFRNEDFKRIAMLFGKEAAQDMIFTLVARK